jgi:hypothetical protein
VIGRGRVLGRARAAASVGSVVRVRARFLVVAVVSAVLLAACSGPDPVSGSIDEVDGGRQVTVPVPWANVSAGTGGIEPSTVWVGQRGDLGFDIDLQGLEAQGAGAAWTAAAAMAAAVATLYSGRDPADVDVAFDITGPIDGPSAAAFLTVAVLAALQDTPLKSGVTMTGTVSPDGSVGAVGGIGLKLQSAADAGYSTVLVPVASQTLTVRGTGEQISVVDYGRELGLDVRPVATVTEAYELLTGTPFLLPSEARYVLPAPVLAVAERTAEALVSNAEAALAAMSPMAPERAVEAVDVADARAALQAGDFALAYGTAVDAVLVAAREDAVERYRTQIESEGLEAAQQSLVDEARSTLDRGRGVIAREADVSGLGLEQVAATPSALGWSTYAVAVLEGLLATLVEPVSEEALLAAAAVVADQVVSIDVLQEDALAIIDAMPSRPLGSPDRATTFLSGYTAFLVRAGQANEAYLRDVIATVPDEAARLAEGEVTSLLPVIGSLSALTATFETAPEGMATEVAESSFAMSYFVSSMSALAAAQAFGIEGFGIGEEAGGRVDEQAISTAIAVSNVAVTALADRAAAEGLDAGSAVWSNEWGIATYAELSSQGRAGAGAVLALNESWFDVIELEILLAMDRAIS